MLNNDKNSYAFNFKHIMTKANILDNKIKQKEKLMNLNGGRLNAEEARNLSDCKLEAIRAKLAILESMGTTNLTAN